MLDQVIPEVLPDVYPFTADLDLRTSGNKQVIAASRMSRYNNYNKEVMTIECRHKLGGDTADVVIGIISLPWVQTLVVNSPDY